LGLEINEVIRGITSFRIIYNVAGKSKYTVEKTIKKVRKGSGKTIFLKLF